jgi:hypothetical protein
VEKNPASPRVSSKVSYDARYDVIMLGGGISALRLDLRRMRKLKHLLSLLDGDCLLHAKISHLERGGTQENAEPVAAPNATPPHP